MLSSVYITNILIKLDFNNRVKWERRLVKLIVIETNNGNYECIKEENAFILVNESSRKVKKRLSII